MVIFGYWTFFFKDLDGYSWLVISSCGEDLRFFGGNNSVTWDEFGYDIVNSFDIYG